MFEAEIAKIATVVPTPSMREGWLRHFEPLQATMTPWDWRQEMRRIAIADGKQYGWQVSSTRWTYSDSGARVNILVCGIQQYARRDDTVTAFTDARRIVIDQGRGDFGHEAIPSLA
ncbi:MAG: hypothetical protein R3E83_19060 [Burkholderiaceae bacterium]